MIDDLLTSESFQVVFPVGHNSSTSCVSITITNDTDLEGDHDFSVAISSAGTAPYAVIGSPSNASVTIIDKAGKFDIKIHLYLAPLFPLQEIKLQR